MKITRLRTNRLENPLGFQMDTARISYIITEAEGKRQRAARVYVSLCKDFHEILFDSGESENIDNICYELPFILKPRTRYYWKVAVWSDCNEYAESETAWFETAKQDEEWQAFFITQSFQQNIHPVLFRDFEIKKEVSGARAYITGLGVFELYLNGAFVGDEYLLPGLHAYDDWLQYITFELELKKGKNRLEAYLGEGWYKGKYGLSAKSPRHGEEYALLAEIHIAYADGTSEIILTDENWKARKSKVLYDSIYDGEVYDAGVDDSEVYEVKPAKLDTRRLQARLSPKIMMHERLKPKLLHTPAGEYVLDFGQNMVGWVEFQVNAPAGTEILLQYGEILQNGNFYRDNMRKALCEYRYISNGNADIARAHFSFYGFRFVKVTGWPGEPEEGLFTGCVIHSYMEETGKIVTSNPLVNRLIENVRWGQKGNFLDVPTDCPQRDERMGWTGDAQIFSDTASYNMDTYAFFNKFGFDLALEQNKLGGSVPYVVPMSRYELGGATAWGDAATVIPWQAFLHFGDKDILKRQYGSMKAWVEYMQKADEKTGGKRLWTTGRHFGDWLALDGKVTGGVYGATDAYYIATAYYYYSTCILAKTAAILDKKEDAVTYQRLAEEIKEAFEKEYFTPTGRLSIDTQTAYAVAAYMDLVPEAAKERFSNDFRIKMKENAMELNTGFVGTPYLCPALTEYGHNDISYQLLLNESFPSWLYEVKMGATTIWERWNSVLEDGSISGTGMNSLNHYAYGSIEGWMYRYMVGINPLEDAPGFRKVLIAPKPDYRIEKVNAELMTTCGCFISTWEIKEEKLYFSFDIPFGVQAELVLPDAAGCEVSGNDGTDMEDCGRNKVVHLCAGHYEFNYFPNRPYRHQFSIESRIKDLMAREDTRALIQKYFPKAISGVPFQSECTLLEELSRSPFSMVEDEAIERLDEELRNVYE